MASALCLVVVIYLIGSTLTDAKAVYNLSSDDPAGSSRNKVFVPNNSEAMLRDALSVTVEEVKPTSGGYKFLLGTRADGIPQIEIDEVKPKSVGYQILIGAERTVFEDYAKKTNLLMDARIGEGVLKSAAG